MLIHRNKQFLTRLWALGNDERPGYLIGYASPRMKDGRGIPSGLSSDGGDTVRDRLLDASKYLHAQLDEIDNQLALRGDFVPALCPTIGSVGIASAFGCEVVWRDYDLPTVRAAVGDDPDALFALQMPSVIDGELGRMLDYTAYFIEQTAGRYPIRMSDVQGPLDNAALIMGHENLRMAMRTRPKAVHSLLQKITNLTITFVQAQRDLAMCYGCGFVPSTFQPWMPDGSGISITNDECVMISTQMHDEFSVPYLNQLSEAFGGIYLHSCGKWAHQIPSLAKVRQLRGHEFGAGEAPFETVLESFGGKMVLACRVELNRDLKFDGIPDYIRRVLAASKTCRGLFINVDISSAPIDESGHKVDLDALYTLLESSIR